METVNEAARTIAEYLKLEDEPEKADVIFILGGSSLEPLTEAFRLYSEGFAPKIAFISTGGTYGGEKIWGMPEHAKYKQELTDAGVPESDIISAGLTSNTGAEATEAIPFLRSRGIDPKKVILVSRPFHQRRAWATFAKMHPDVKYINCPADEAFTETPGNLQRLLDELVRLVRYEKKGDVVFQEIPLRALSAAGALHIQMEAVK